MARQDRYNYNRPEYDWIQPKYLNFLIALVCGIPGGFRQGSMQVFDPWDFDEGVEIINKLLFRGK